VFSVCYFRCWRHCRKGSSRWKGRCVSIHTPTHTHIHAWAWMDNWLISLHALVPDYALCCRRHHKRVHTFMCKRKQMYTHELMRNNKNKKLVLLKYVITPPHTYKPYNHWLCAHLLFLCSTLWKYPILHHDDLRITHIYMHTRKHAHTWLKNCNVSRRSEDSQVHIICTGIYSTKHIHTNSWRLTTCSWTHDVMAFSNQLRVSFLLLNGFPVVNVY
jgi:hypothetical protein